MNNPLFVFEEGVGWYMVPAMTQAERNALMALDVRRERKEQAFIFGAGYRNRTCRTLLDFAYRERA